MSDDTTRPNPRKIREGLVTSNKMDRTAVVSVVDRKPHPLYRKTVQHTTKLYVHDEANDLNVGDRVRVQETRRQLLDLIVALAASVRGFALNELNPMTDTRAPSSILTANLVFQFAVAAAQRPETRASS